MSGQPEITRYEPCKLAGTWVVGDRTNGDSFVMGDGESAHRLAELLNKSAERNVNLIQERCEAVSELSSLRASLRALAIAMHRDFYSHVTQWEPFDYVRGLLSQIDNMYAGIRADRLAERTAIKELAKGWKRRSDEGDCACDNPEEIYAKCAAELLEKTK